MRHRMPPAFDVTEVAHAATGYLDSSRVPTPNGAYELDFRIPQ